MLDTPSHPAVPLTCFHSSFMRFVVVALCILAATGDSFAEEKSSAVRETTVLRPVVALRIADFQRVFAGLELFGSQVLENAGPFVRQWLEWKLFPVPLDDAWLGNADAWFCFFEDPTATPPAGKPFQSFTPAFGWAIPIKDVARPLAALSALFGPAQNELGPIFVFSPPQEPGKKTEGLWLCFENDRILLASSASHLKALRAWLAEQSATKPEGDVEVRIPVAPWRNRYGAAFALAALLTPGQAARLTPVEQDAVKNACAAIFKRLLDADELRLRLTLPPTPDAPASLKLKLLPRMNEDSGELRPAAKRRAKWEQPRFISPEAIWAAALPLDAFFGLEPNAFLPWLTVNCGQKETTPAVFGRRSPNTPPPGADDWEKILNGLNQRGRTDRQTLCALFSFSSTKDAEHSRFPFGFETSFSEPHRAFLSDNVFPVLAFLGIGENALRRGRFGCTADYWFLGMGPNAEKEVKRFAEFAEMPRDSSLGQDDLLSDRPLLRLFELLPDDADALLLLRPLKALRCSVERVWPDDLALNEALFHELNDAPVGLSLRLERVWELELFVPAQAVGNVLRFHWRLLNHEKFWTELMTVKF